MAWDISALCDQWTNFVACNYYPMIQCWNGKQTLANYDPGPIAMTVDHVSRCMH